MAEQDRLRFLEPWEVQRLSEIPSLRSATGLRNRCIMGLMYEPAFAPARLAGEGLSLTDIVPCSLQTQGIGRLLFESMKMDMLLVTELDDVRQLLSEDYSLPEWGELGL